jgi:hypothetical protein
MKKGFFKRAKKMLKYKKRALHINQTKRIKKISKNKSIIKPYSKPFTKFKKRKFRNK